MDARKPPEPELRELVESLDEQRACLVEQVSAVAVARDRFRDEATAMLAELEELAKSLSAREARLDAQEAAFRVAAAHLKRVTGDAEARQFRLAKSEAESDGREERRDAEVAFREGQLRRRERALDEMCHRWAERRRAELCQFREALARLALERSPEVGITSDQWAELQQSLLHSATRFADSADRLTARERAIYADTQEEADAFALLAAHTAQRGAYERELTRLRAEMERLAASLIDAPDLGEEPEQRAA